jgi:flagellar hook-associated protein 1 FlgK
VSDYGLSILSSALTADQAILDTAGNNLANIDTPGYAREQVDLAPVAGAGSLTSGAGVMITSIQALTDAIYGAANVSALGTQGGAGQANEVYQSIESIFPEPSSTGLSAQIGKFFSDLQSLSANPGEAGAQQAVAADAQTIAGTFTSSSTQLTQLAGTLQTQVGTGVDDGGMLSQVNGLLGQIAQLNEGIVAGTAAGQDVNALGDQQRNAMNQLAGLIGATATTESNGAMTVRLGGIELVSATAATELATTGSAGGADLQIVTSSGAPVTAGGSIGANVQAVDTVLPGYQSRLSGVADALAQGINTLQAGGMDAAGDPGSAIAGGWGGTVLPDIFVNGGSASTYTAGTGSAATFSVSPAFAADPSLLATAAAPGPGNSNVIGTPTLDGTNAQAMAALASSATGPDAVYQSFIGQLGTEAAAATAASTTATSLASTAGTNLASVSGVNQNEEEITILSAQNAFQAASKAVTAIQTALQSLLQVA